MPGKVVREQGEEIRNRESLVPVSSQRKWKEKEETRERKETEIFARSTGCTKRIQFDGITITGVMSENNEISPNHHSSPRIRFFAPFVPSLILSPSFSPFFPFLFIELRSSIVYHTGTRMDMYRRTRENE